MFINKKLRNNQWLKTTAAFYMSHDESCSIPLENERARRHQKTRCNAKPAMYIENDRNKKVAHVTGWVPI